MPSMQKILSECRDEDLLSLCIQNTETGSYAKWWQYPFVDIDYSRLRKGMTELPLVKMTESLEMEIILASVAFRLYPTDPSKIQVIDLNKCQKRGAFDRENNPSNVYSYSNNSVGRPINVNTGTKLKVVNQLFKLLRIHRRGEAAKPEGRIRLDYGDTNTLKSWEKTYDVSGYIGSTSGKEREFILVSNSRSMGGGTIMTDCILSIRDSRKTLQHYSSEPGYHYHYILNELFTNPLRKIE